MIVFTRQVYDHESAQNVFAESSLWDRAEAYKNIYEASGKEHEAAVAKVALILGGATKVRTATRWRDIAFDVLPQVREYYKTPAGKQLTQKMVLDNKYLTGKSPGQSYNAKFKLSAYYAINAIDQMAMKITQGGKVPAAEFVDGYCYPNRRVQQWAKDVVDQFGNVATSYSACNRVIESLGTEGGRQKVLQCVGNKKKFDEDGGIPECKAVVDEMKKAKAGVTMAAKEREADVTGGQSPSVAEGAGPSNAEPPLDDLLEALSRDAETAEGQPVKDAVVECALAMTAKDMVHVNMHTTAAEFLADIKNRVLPTSMVLVYVDAATSKPQYLYSFLAHRNEFPKTHSVFIPVGRRFQVLAGLLENLSRGISKDRAPFVVESSFTEDQSLTERPTYTVFLPALPSQKVPVRVNLKGCRTQYSECLDLVCASHTCPGRPGSREAKPDAGKPGADETEVGKDDQEAPNEFTDMFTEDKEDATAEEDANRVRDALGGQAASPPEECAPVKLFAFGNPVSYYAKHLLEVCDARRFSHIFIYSRTAHPALLVAARSVGLDVTVLHEGISPHSLYHGELLLRQLLTESHMPAARQKIGSDVRGIQRSSARPLQWIDIQAPSEQPIHFNEVAAKEESQWRGGCELKFH